MKKLSKDYRLVSIASFIGILIAFVFIQLPQWIHNEIFWQLVCYSFVAIIFFILTNMYINAGKLSRSYNATKQ